MKRILIVIFPLMCLVGCNHQNALKTKAIPGHLNQKSLVSAQGMTVSLSSNKVDDCSDPSAKLTYTVVGGGAHLQACQGYALSTQNSRNGEAFHCAGADTFVDLNLRADWSYDSQTDTWSSIQALSGPQDKDFGIPGSYSVYFKSSDGNTIKSVSYQLVNPNGNPNYCGARYASFPAAPSPGIAYPVTILTAGNFAGTYNSYNEFASKVNVLGYGNSCVAVNGVLAYSNSFPPCLQLSSSSTGTGQPTPTPTPVVQCQGAKPADQTQVISCPSGQVGSVTQSRTYSCITGSWTAGNWADLSNNCVSSTPGNGDVCINSAGQAIPQTSNMRMQPMYPGGTNNYVFDSNNYTNNGRPGLSPGVNAPTGTVQVFQLPSQWVSGNPIRGATASFASFIVYNQIGAQYEVSISKCKNDFSYYKTPQASYTYPGNSQLFQPCGLVAGPDYNISWAMGVQSDVYSCGIPDGETWYLNWRVVPGTCPTNSGYTCGQTFYVPGGN